MLCGTGALCGADQKVVDHGRVDPSVRVPGLAACGLTKQTDARVRAPVRWCVPSVSAITIGGSVVYGPLWIDGPLTVIHIGSDTAFDSRLVDCSN